MAYNSADVFFKEYTSQDAISKYTKATAGFGISYLLDHDYKQVYADALALLPPQATEQGLRILEFGCGGGMNLLHMVSWLGGTTFRVEKAIGTDFSPVLVEAARRESEKYLSEDARRKVEFHVARNETLIDDLASATETAREQWKNTFQFILGVNTSRYCHRANKELAYAQDVFDLMIPGGICVVIDMNDRFLFFKSAMKNRLSKGVDPEECRIPSLEEYTSPFRKVGFEVIRSEHFCWVPHSSGPVMCHVLRTLSPILDTVAKSRAMRSLVVLQKPVRSSH